jgi:hypothetical protein
MLREVEMKRYVLIGLLCVSALPVFAQSEELEMYTYLYNGAATIVDQLGVLQNMAAAEISGAGDFYANALERLLAGYPNARGSTERAAADAAARLLANALGEEKYTAAGGNLWRTVEVFSNSLVKADALIALGKAGAMDLLPQVVQLLSDLNTRPSEDREAGERIAYGAVLSLENYKHASGYLPVFFASAGWYSDRVKSRAAASLAVILPDPSGPITSVLQSSGYTYDIKYYALQTIEQSDITARAKAAVAVTALTEAWRASTREPRQRIILANSRKLAINMLRRYGTDDAAVFPLLERSYNEGADEEERLGVVAALAALGSDDAARLLSSFLMAINGRLQSNLITPLDERLIRAIIPALGATGRSIAGPALRSVQALDWTGAVKNLAAEALKGIR